MSAYAIAWLVIVGAAALGALVFFVWLGAKVTLGRMIVVFAVLGFFLLPAPVPGFDGHIAPAFVVAIFELFFQTDGHPEVSLRILGLGLAAIVGVVIGIFLLIRRMTSARDSEPDGST